jgi:hypothetical protein
MAKFKLKATPEEICNDDRSKCLLPVLKEAYSLAYEEEPQYGKFKFMLMH